MKPFLWDDELFSTGVELVDEQHKYMLDLLNGYMDKVSKRETKADDFQQVITALKEYAEYHFSCEEKLMEEYQLVDEHILMHKKVHRTFIFEVSELEADLQQGDKSGSMEKHIFEFLSQWFVYHILGSDQNMSKQIAAIDKGLTPREAFEQEERELNKNNGPLLKALQALFHQVSLRNKELIALNQSLEEKVVQRTQELTKMNSMLTDLSHTDSLTELGNRRVAMRELKRVWNDSEQLHQPMSCMMIDLDKFKLVNDNHGHANGDKVLIAVAKKLIKVLPSNYIISRLGGDEFFVICPDTNEKELWEQAKLALESIQNLKVTFDNGEFWHGSLSIGIAVRNDFMWIANELVKGSDVALYAAKEAGRNCIHCYSSRTP